MKKFVGFNISLLDKVKKRRHHCLSLEYNLDFSSSSGSVIIELLIVLPIFVTFFMAMVDYAFLLREEIILSESARTAVRAVLAAPNFQEDPDGDSLSSQQLQYATERFQRAIEVARYLVASNNLNPDDYNYNALSHVREDIDGRFSYTTLQVNISSREANRFFLFPENSFKVCVGSGAIVPGVVLAENFAVVDPEFDPECSPQVSGI